MSRGLRLHRVTFDNCPMVSSTIVEVVIKEVICKHLFWLRILGVWYVMCGV
jgi:hypothetical protein